MKDFTKHHHLRLGKELLELFIWLLCIVLVYLLSLLVNFNNYWNIWNYISIGAIGLFSLLVYFLFNVGKKEKRKDILIESGLPKLLAQLLLYFLPFAIAFGICLYTFAKQDQPSFENEFGKMTLIGTIIVFIMFSLGDAYVWRYFQGKINEEATPNSNENKYMSLAHEHRTNLLILDLPFLISFCFLYFYWNMNVELPNIDIFMGGASAFQLLAQNTAFIINTRIF